jgi:hypothetical protein
MSIYSAAWRYGEGDRNKVKFGHIPYQPWRGWVAGAFGELPFLALAAAWLVWSGQWFLYLAVIPAAIVASGVGYFAGYRMFRIIDKLVYRGKPKKTKKRHWQ